MIRIILIFIGCLLFLNLNGQNLDSHEWENRILIIKAETEASKDYQNQMKELSNSSEEFKERKLILYQIIGNKYDQFDYNHNEIKVSGEISNKLSGEILNEKNPFEIILIGLDGGIKLKRTDLIEKEELFNIIDSMPLRSSELRNKN